jgi:hypothetical protein
LTGPLDGKSYRDVMVPMPGTDEWVAGIASYVRTNFGNSGGMVTPEDVARVRAEVEARKAPWTEPELEASLPRPLDPLQFKFTASHAPAAAVGAATLRGWNSGVPQTPGVWLTVELPQPVVVTELQFEALSQNRGGRGRGAPGAAPAAGAAATPTGAATASATPEAPAAAEAGGGAAAGAAQGFGGRGGPGGIPVPVFGYPRGYTVQVSTDGTTWSNPLAQGKGQGTRTTIALPPTRAKFIRITQTETAPDAPSWSVRNLKVFEAAR